MIGDPMYAKDIMCKTIFYASYHDSMIQCASLFKEKNIGFLPIVHGKTVVGVITDRDLCIRGITEKKSFLTPIENIMSKQIIVVPQNTNLSDVLKTMEMYRIKRILVHENQKIVGIISLSDLLSIKSEEQNILKTIKKIYTLDQIQTIIEPKVNEFYL